VGVGGRTAQWGDREECIHWYKPTWHLGNFCDMQGLLMVTQDVTSQKETLLSFFLNGTSWISCIYIILNPANIHIYTHTHRKKYIVSSSFYCWYKCWGNKDGQGSMAGPLVGGILRTDYYIDHEERWHSVVPLTSWGNYCTMEHIEYHWPLVPFWFSYIWFSYS
jgi:hypothetical protein